MKKIYTLVILLACSFAGQAQTIPNGSFEEWTSINGYPEPVDWATFNVLSFLFQADYSVTQETPGVDGDYYLKLAAQVNPLDTSLLPAVAYVGSFNFGSENGTAGFPVSNIPSFLSGSYRSSILDGDYAGIFCFFTRWNTGLNTSDTLALATLEITTDVADWTTFDIPIIPMMTGTPDTCNIFLLSGGGEVGVGSVFDIDDLHFSGNVQSVDEASAAPFHIYPNPFQHELMIDLRDAKNPCNIIVYDSQGRMVEQVQQSNTARLMDLSHLSSGLYTVHIFDGPQRWSHLIQKL
jgi:hypothetical protein